MKFLRRQASSKLGSRNKVVSFNEDLNLYHEQPNGVVHSALNEENELSADNTWYSKEDLKQFRDHLALMVRMARKADEDLVDETATFTKGLQRLWKNECKGAQDQNKTMDLREMERLYSIWYTRYGLEKHLAPSLAIQTTNQREDLLDLVFLLPQNFAKAEKENGKETEKRFRGSGKQSAKKVQQRRGQMEEDLRQACEKVSLPSRRFAQAIAAAVATA